MQRDAEMGRVQWMLVACLALLLPLNVMVYNLGEKMDTQSAILLSIKEGVQKPMSTIYTDTDGFAHTVSTPYQGEGTAREHKIDLCHAFAVFRPESPPAWWTAGMDCNSIR